MHSNTSPIAYRLLPIAYCLLPIDRSMPDFDSVIPRRGTGSLKWDRRPDLDPFLTSMYLMTSFMSILSMEDKWKLVIEAEGFSYERFCSEFFRFIIPAISSGEASRMDVKDFASWGFVLTSEKK